MELEFTYDIACPYAWLALLRLAAWEADGVRVTHRPVALARVLRAVGAPGDPLAVLVPARRADAVRDLERRAAALDVRLVERPWDAGDTVLAMQLLAGAPVRARPALAHDLFHAHWGLGRDLSDPGVLDVIARRHGMTAAAATSEASALALQRGTDEFIAGGGFGVPSFGLGAQRFFGSDRMHFVLESLGRRPEPFTAPAGGGGHIVFFHDFASPYSYLGSTVVEQVAARHGATVEWVPILLGALFRGIGTPNVPMLEMSPARQRWVVQDLQQWARWWGVPLRFPGVFPQRTVTALRVAVVEPRVTPHLYTAVWADDQDLGDPRALARVLNSAGFDAEALIEASERPDVKEGLRRNTERARGLGVCGVPTCEVGGELVWGQDRFDVVDGLLGGVSRPD